MKVMILRLLIVVSLTLLVFKICEHCFPLNVSSAGQRGVKIITFPMGLKEPLLTEKVLNVPYINQNELYPNGCESVSTVMVLKYLGMDITVEEFIDSYLDKGLSPRMDSQGKLIGCDPWEEYPGSPYDQTGWGCFAPVIVNALNKLLDKSDFIVEEMYDVSLETLCREFIDRDIPVILWATVGMEAAREGNTWTVPETGKTVTWINPMHCLCLLYTSSGLQ